MNAKTVALFILFLAFGFIAKAVEIPGGIVYSNGKDAIYYDFGTRENKNLTSDFSEAVVIGPFTVSDNGKVLIWLQDSKFYVRELPIGIPRAVQVNRAVFKGTRTKFRSSPKDDIIEDITWEGGVIKNMSLSPDGARFAFDTIFQEPGWIFTGKTVEESGNYFPLYDKIMDSYNGIFYLSTIYNQDLNHASDPVEINFSHPRYGSVMKDPPAPLYKAAQDLYINKTSTRFGGELGTSQITSQMIDRKRTIKKSAHYLTFQNLQNWQNGSKLAAFIYQIGKQWGPIELRVLDSEKQGGTGDDFRQNSSYHSIPPPEKMSRNDNTELFAKTSERKSLTVLGSGPIAGT